MSTGTALLDALCDRRRRWRSPLEPDRRPGRARCAGCSSRSTVRSPRSTGGSPPRWPGIRGYRAIQQISGIGPVFAAVFIAEIGDVARFPTADKLTCWAGLTPRHRESDTTVHRGPSPSRAPSWCAGPRSRPSNAPASRPSPRSAPASASAVAGPGSAPGATSPRSPPPGYCSSWSTTGCATARSARWPPPRPQTPRTSGR